MNDCTSCIFLIRKGGFFYCCKTNELLTLLNDFNNLKGVNGLCPMKKENRGDL